MRTLKELIDRIEVFHDSKEIADELGSIYGSNVDNRYWMAEARTHILGQWELLNDIKKALENESKNLQGLQD